MADIEKDGALIEIPHTSVAGSDNDDHREAGALARWNRKFDEEVQKHEARHARVSRDSEAETSSEDIDPTKTIRTPVRAQASPEPNSEPIVQRRGRAGTFSDAVASTFQRLSRTSTTNQKRTEDVTLGQLAAMRWSSVKDVKDDADGFPALDYLPPKARQALATTHRQFAEKHIHQALRGEEREERLKQELAKRFLAFALMGPDSDFDQSKLGSASAINRYLLKNFSLKMDAEPTSASAELRSPRSPQSPRSPRPSRAPHRTRDFRDALLADSARRLSNYRVDRSYDLGPLAADPFAAKVFDSTIEVARKQEKVSTATDQRSDVTATFQRDFPHSTYAFENKEGTVTTFGSIDEFVAFIGDPGQAGLPKAVSHFACQNLGMFIKNLLFMRMDANGRSESPLKLFDGTPIAISTSPKASYRFSKADNGAITLHYRAGYDTSEAAAAGRFTARLLPPADGRAVLIENAHAEITLDITFQPDATARMGTLRVTAEGWNQVSE